MLDAQKNIKLGDFGLSNEMRDGVFLNTACGSANYAAPEVITGHSYCGTEADIWSLGVILYALLSGKLPFDESNLPALINVVKSAKFTVPYHFSPLATDLIKKIIVANPINRPHIQDIFTHPWIAATNLYKTVNNFGKIEIDSEIFQNLLQHQRFRDLKNVEELKNNILCGESFDLFTVSYEMILFEKRKSISYVEYVNEKKKLQGRKGKIGKDDDESIKDWQYGFILDNDPEEIMINLCGIIKDKGGKWLFINPYCLKVIFRHQIKHMRLKIMIRLYTVSVI